MAPAHILYALALFAAPLNASATLLRRGRRFRSAASASKGQSSFDSLTECQVAFDSIKDHFSSASQFYTEPSMPMESEPRYPYHGPERRDDLIKDDRGGSIITSDPKQLGRAGRLYYRPPASDSGEPSDFGWDYRANGEDWEKMGNCAGPGQSPVDLARYIDVQGQTKYVLWFDYYMDPHLNESTKELIENDGHALRYRAMPSSPQMGYLKIGNDEFEFTEYMFHAPSEHSLDGAVFPLELQIYHKKRNGEGMAAVSVLFREGTSNPFLDGLRSSLSGVGPRWTVRHGKSVGKLRGAYPEAFDLAAVIPRGNVQYEPSFYNYQGSLTQPPCTRGVDWWVLSDPVTATRAEITFIRRAIFSSGSMKHGNARNTMPLGDRTILVGLMGAQHAVRGLPSTGQFVRDSSISPRGYNSQDDPWGKQFPEGGEPGEPGEPDAEAVPMSSPSPAPLPSESTS